MERKFNVLIVDDEQKNINLLSALLKPFSEKYSVIATCTSINEARKMIVRLLPDLIFLDIQMPGGTGFDLLSELNTLGIHVAVVFVTAHDKFMKKAFKTQPFDYLLKPVDPNELAETLLRFQNQFNKKPLPESKSAPEKLKIKSVKGIEFANPKDVMYIEFINRKSFVCLTDSTVIETNYPLKTLVALINQKNIIYISLNYS